MSKARAMQVDQARALRPPKPPEPPPPPPPAGPLLRWVRQGARARVWRPWWLLGLLEVVTYPGPRFRAALVRYEPGIRASCGLPARAGFFMEVAA